ncbi:hypothetical protein GDO81_008727 [Engystomops pustulosus]|uniref:Uncharacterized protein n=1 Tax=Engystomops pustulosus TaxID=76066 RepID=A0AAV7CGN1_ENGPU|nr:hypothetical protein GDO81_008727 [Engystomops pustulosus]
MSSKHENKWSPLGRWHPFMQIILQHIVKKPASPTNTETTRCSRSVNPTQNNGPSVSIIRPIMFGQI